MADITSANVVGYKTEAMTAGKLNMHTVQFNQVGKDGFNLNEDLVIANAVGTENWSESDMIKIWDPATSGYKLFYFYNDGSESGWTDFDTDQYFEECNDPLPAGTAFWYSAQANAKALDMTSSGEVDSDGDTTYVLTAGKLNMLGSPYPAPYSLNNTDEIVFANSVGTENWSESDMIKIWDPATSGYKLFYFYDDGEESGWTDFDTDQYFEECNDPIQAGVAWWYSAQPNAKELKITFKKTF